MANFIRKVPAVRKPTHPPHTLQDEYDLAVWERDELQRSDADGAEILAAVVRAEVLRKAIQRQAKHFSRRAAA